MCIQTKWTKIFCPRIRIYFRFSIILLLTPARALPHPSGRTTNPYSSSIPNEITYTIYRYLIIFMRLSSSECWVIVVHQLGAMQLNYRTHMSTRNRFLRFFRFYDSISSNVVHSVTVLPHFLSHCSTTFIIIYHFLIGSADTILQRSSSHLRAYAWTCATYILFCRFVTGRRSRSTIPNQFYAQT